MMDVEWHCPRCNSNGGIVIRVRVSGYEEHFMLPGEGQEYGNNDNVRYHDSKIGACIRCGRRVSVDSVRQAGKQSAGS